VRLGCFTACHVDATNLGGQEAERVRELFDRHRLELSSLGYYDNPLHPDPAVRNYPGNLAYSPELWEWMFSLGVELNFDPSHLVWLGVDPLGKVDWRRLVDAMYEGGFDGTLSVEHEDPVWGGDTDRVKAGLEIAHRTLRPLLVR
jgi:sugar phosphate isomerase/epimerase